MQQEHNADQSDDAAFLEKGVTQILDRAWIKVERS